MKKILNIGCGTKTSSNPNIINIDWSIYLIFKRSKFLNYFAPLIFRGNRKIKYKNLPNNIMAYNLKKPLPFEDKVVDVIYSSHVFEHIDRDKIFYVLAEWRRVLKKGGLLRIVVPDLFLLIKNYQKSFKTQNHNHDKAVAEIFEQCVRKEAFGTSKQNKFYRLIENFLLGDARKRGETHQWMYDELNLSQILITAGFINIKIHRYNTSSCIELLELDIDEFGNQYKPDSMYVEAVKLDE